ncbi:unnamed protein product [Acanthoscelides obtectus]|uniref:Transposase n=1 Tax=Acanthoscelides obtectus TaxID=200917 RepID=A0A9P0KYJ3_ACAOB|nr:unnamed protein product [Acanthoscelides obtectus]CAK1628580.1 hypothetical protein AOBTE_LOCUS5285 [Acanthoscelides obtectus]
MELNREHLRLLFVFGNEAPHQSTISRWYGEFKRGRVSLSDDPRVGAPKTAGTQENVDAVRKLIIEDRYVTYREIEASLKISKTSIQKILHEELGVRKLQKSWIYCYEPENKRQSAVWVFQAEENVELLDHPPYSPDLSPNNFFTFRKVKNRLRGQRFQSPEEAVDAFKNAVLDLPANEWNKCFENWFERMQMCINLRGENFEKQ